jgi:hypothetical protein
MSGKRIGEPLRAAGHDVRALQEERAREHTFTSAVECAIVHIERFKPPRQASKCTIVQNEPLTVSRVANMHDHAFHPPA